jgi:acyl-CoA thioesterase
VSDPRMPRNAPLPNPLPVGEREVAPVGERESEPSRTWSWFGMELVETGEGTATVDMIATDDMANHSGFVHGGIISTLADSAMGRSVRTLKPGVKRAMSFDLKLNFINAAKIGESLRATAKVVHAGRRTVVTECRVEGKDERLVATASATFTVTREKE